MRYNVSVIIPLHNCAHSIAKMLQSICDQELIDTEILVIDDGSVGNGVALVENYKRKYSNISLYKIDKTGEAAFLYDIAFQKASGEYVVVLDFMGWLPSKALHNMYQAAKDKDADVIVSQYLKKENGSEWIPCPAVRELTECFDENNCVGNLAIPAADPYCFNKMIRKALLEQNQIHFPLGRSAGNLAFLISVFEHASSVYMLDETVYLYEENIEGDLSDSYQAFRSMDGELQMLMSLGMKFHDAGQIDVQSLNLEHLFKGVLNCFLRLPEGEDKNSIFENIKAYLSLYRGYKEYRIVVENLMGMDLETVLSLPYPTYARQKKMLQP